MDGKTIHLFLFSIPIFLGTRFFVLEKVINLRLQTANEINEIVVY